MASTYVYASTYTRTQAVIFMSDNLRIVLRDVILEYGLNPEKLLLQDWETIERGIRSWLLSGHLNAIVVEFFRPGVSLASARWDVPIRYVGSGAMTICGLTKRTCGSSSQNPRARPGIVRIGFCSAPTRARPRWRASAMPPFFRQARWPLARAERLLRPVT